VTFDGKASNDPDGTIVSYAWDFGDGGSGTGVAPSHTYASAGTYTVSLKVTDDAGASDSDTTEAEISAVPNVPPTANANSPYTGEAGTPVTFDGKASNDPDGTIVSYAWDFGDSKSGAGVSPTHTYAVPGDYIVSLTVTDDGGLTDTATTTATIAVEPPPVPGDGEVRITQAEWEAEKSKLKVRGEGTIGEEVIITNADTGEHLGEAEVDERGKWKLDVFNLSSGPCSVRAALEEYPSAEVAREVKNAPNDCRDDDDDDDDDSDSDDSDDDDDDDDDWRAKIREWLRNRD